ncbi:plasmid mobilization relaxosome protein MobC [Actinomyces minihominis]|uniref:plasmid mobilization relaxosome protein MobC n=1 Tax=Actinomyces minihominis TaxID=2002838 RepID=UPI000C08B15F|nr:plasmid mobilization relaxosome protein MobC [Actinomyces minihominis]
MLKNLVQDSHKARRREERPNRITVRLSNTELDGLEVIREALEVGAGSDLTTSDVVRLLISTDADAYAAAMREGPSPDDLAMQTGALDSAAEQLENLRSELRKIGVNLNQLTRVANVTDQVDRDAVSTVGVDLRNLTTKLDVIEDFLMDVAFADSSNEVVG